jgi:N-methylhydantoinase A
MAWRIGIDIGGTFTDVAMVEEDSGRIAIAKVLTTPRDFGQGVIDGIRADWRRMPSTRRMSCCCRMRRRW